MQLTEILKTKGINPPGITSEGAAWLAKTLHPADNIPPWTGVPTGSGMPSVVMEYEALLRVGPQAGSAGTYTAYINMIPHPIQPLSVTVTDSVGNSDYGLYNPTLYTAGNIYSTMTENLAGLAGAYRMTHLAVTMELDAPALSNQGSVTAAQYPLSFYEFNPSYPLQAGADAGKLWVGNHIRMYNFPTNEIDYEALAAKPFSYSGLAKDGCYMVLKTDPDAPWVHIRDTVKHPAQTAYIDGIALTKTLVASNQPFPWYGGNYPVADRFRHAYVDLATTAGAVSGSFTPKIQQENFGRMGLWNLSVNAGLTLRVRWGVEYLVQPNSPLAPNVRMCAPRDDIALTAYSRIVDQLPDAFPGSYNSWNELGSVLKRAWTAVSPSLAAIAGLHPAGQAVMTGIKAIGDMVVAPPGKKQKGTYNYPRPEFVVVKQARVKAPVKQQLQQAKAARRKEKRRAAASMQAFANVD